MFVVLITSIANAQTASFDFSCTSAEARTNRLAQLDYLETKHNVLNSSLSETGNGPEGHVRYNYQVVQGTDETYYFGAFDFIEDVTDWSTKIKELEDQINPPGLTPAEIRAERSALITDLEGTNGVTNITVAYQSNDNYVYISTSKGRFYFASDDGNYTQNTSLVGSGHLEAYSQGSFDTRLLAFKIFLDPSFELTNSIEAMYDADTHPETLASVIFDAAGVAYDNRSDNASDPRLAFISKLDKFGVVFEGFNNSNGNRYVTFVDDTIDPIQAPVDGVNLTTADFQEWMLRIARGIWLYEHQDYIYEQRKLDRIAEILAIDTVDGVSISQDGSTFTISNGDKDNTSSVDISDAILYAYYATDFLAKKVEVQSAYGVQSTNLATREARSNALINGNKTGYVTIVADYDTARGDLFNISYGGTTLHEYADTHAGGYIRLENLTEGNGSEFNNLDSAINAKVVELTPTIAKELAAWFDDTDTAPVGSAPQWLPPALSAEADTKYFGTHRYEFIRNGLLSAHGVTITQASTVFTLSSPNSEYDVTVDYAPYSENGFHKDAATPELYRNLVFDIIKTGWKLVNETHNTKRSDWLDQDLDITGNNVELQTYGGPNFDWWIYFNVDGLRIPILSGGIASDPMFYNKHTVNPHDTYMTEVEFQTLVTFVTYMRDNFDRLKGITGTFGRNIEISNLTDEFGVGISVTNVGGSYHYTFSKNGNSNEYPVQSNWTHAAGTTLGDLNPDSWVKFYAKCRGIILGL